MGFGYTQEIAEQCIALCGKLGYDGIEFWKQYLDTADLDWVRRACADANLEIFQVCPYFDFTESKESYEKTLREAERFVERCRVGAATFEEERLDAIEYSVRRLVHHYIVREARVDDLPRQVRARLHRFREQANGAGEVIRKPFQGQRNNGRQDGKQNRVLQAGGDHDKPDNLFKRSPRSSYSRMN